MWEDFQAGYYTPMESIVRLSEKPLKSGSLNDVKTSLESNIWYEARNSEEKSIIAHRSLLLQGAVPELLQIIQARSSHNNVLHISTGGSYAWKPLGTNVNDIDFNVIVSGSYFEYFDYFELCKIRNFTTNPLKKVSFTVFGEDNLTKGIATDDRIRSADYLQTQVSIREGIVMPFRNTTIYGSTLSPGDTNPASNLLIRIDRQLFQAGLFLSQKLEAKYSAEERLQKSQNRTVEAGILLNHVFLKRPELISRYKHIEDFPAKSHQQVSSLLKEVRALRNGTQSPLRPSNRSRNGPPAFRA